ncbi:MAG: hypothetical protein CVV39_08275 [Planctomycetes bacterium HGW-Planctomycetes-1]|nr:MAG: hypothetical protein CVV39_08275 [Planctomycetes bacterium HGW-Planctomycetes-1]
MKRSHNLTPKLKTSAPEIRNYIFELEKENLKLQKQIAKLEVKNVSLQHQIAALKKAQPKQIMKVVRFADVKNKNLS